MSKPRYKVGDLIQLGTHENKLYLIVKVHKDTGYDSVYDLLTEDGKVIWQFCDNVDNCYPYRKIN